MILLEEISRHAREMPDKTAVIEGDREITYRQLWDRIVSASRLFRSVGEKGERVVLAANKSVDFVYSYFGAQLAGLVTVTVDSGVNELRLKRICDSARPKAVFGTLDTCVDGFGCQPFPDFSDTDGSGSDAATFPADGNKPDAVVLPSESDLADILYTTGTTGFPKGVTLSHRNEACAAAMINEFIGNTQEDRELLALPISHSFGLGRLRCTLARGGTIDLLGSFANMKRFFRELESRRITGFGMVPASWNYMKKFSGEKIGGYANQIRYIEIGSAPMKTEDKKLLMELLPKTQICMHYGLTEASRSAFISFHDDREFLNSIGHPSPGVDIKIMDEQGDEVSPGEQGELCVKGGHVCCSYWGSDQDRYKESFWGEYFRTGDWGYEDERGYFYLVSRKKELINVGGKKVSPAEVEEVINTVDGVEESACIGEPDDVMGEVVKAFVVRNKDSLTDKEILNATRRNLESYKVPAMVEFIDEIPKTSSGKVQRLLLKK